MTKVYWDRIARGVQRENHRMIWKPYGAPAILDLERSALHDAPISVPWSIPDKIAVSVAITGAFFREDQNPNQPLTPASIRDSAMAVLDAGASTVHIHVRDDKGYNVVSLERFDAVIRPLKDKYPDLVVDGCLVPALDGEWQEMRRVLEARLLDAAPVSALPATIVVSRTVAVPVPIPGIVCGNGKPSSIANG